MRAREECVIDLHIKESLEKTFTYIRQKRCKHTNILYANYQSSLPAHLRLVKIIKHLLCNHSAADVHANLSEHRVPVVPHLADTCSCVIHVKKKKQIAFALQQRLSWLLSKRVCIIILSPPLPAVAYAPAASA